MDDTRRDFLATVLVAAGAMTTNLENAMNTIMVAGQFRRMSR